MVFTGLTRDELSGVGLRMRKLFASGGEGNWFEPDYTGGGTNRIKLPLFSLSLPDYKNPGKSFSAISIVFPLNQYYGAVASYFNSF